MGIGLFCDLQEQGNRATVFIQASMVIAPSVLQAKAAGLLLPAQIASLLELQKVTFVTDSTSLAKAAAATSASAPQVLWVIRCPFAQFIQVREALHAAVSRCTIFYNFAHQAIRQSESLPILSCSNSAHRNRLCPIT
jgi:hypothetical protein